MVIAQKCRDEVPEDLKRRIAEALGLDRSELGDPA